MLWMVVLWLQAALASEPISVQNPEDVLCPPLVPCERRLDVETLKLANESSPDPPLEPLSTDPIVDDDYDENVETEAPDREEEPTVLPAPSSRSVPEHGPIETEAEEDATEAVTEAPALEQRRVTSDDFHDEHTAFFRRPPQKIFNAPPQLPPPMFFHQQQSPPQFFNTPPPPPRFFNTPPPQSRFFNTPPDEPRFFNTPPPPIKFLKAAQIERSESHVRVTKKYDPASGKTEICECRSVMMDTVERKPLHDIHRETIRIVSPFVEQTRLRITAKEPKPRAPILFKKIPDPQPEDLTMATGTRINSNAFYRFRKPAMMGVSQSNFYPQYERNVDELQLIEVTTPRPQYVLYDEPSSDSRFFGGYEQQYTAVNSYRPTYAEFLESHMESMDHSEEGDDEICLMLRNKGHGQSQDEYYDDGISGQYTSKLFRPVGSTSVSLKTTSPSKVYRETRIEESRPFPSMTYFDWMEMTQKHKNERRITSYPPATKRPDNWETLYLKGSLQQQRDARGRDQPWQEQFHFRRESESRKNPNMKSIQKIIRQGQMKATRNTRRTQQAHFDAGHDFEEKPMVFSRQDLKKSLMQSRSTAEDDKHMPSEQQGSAERAQDMDTEEDAHLNQNECGMVGVKPRVVNGKIAAEGQFPWLSYLRIFRDDVSFMCAASIITPRYVLTAAHCLLQAGVPPTSMEVVCGVVNKTDGDPIPVHSYKMHPDYGRVPREKHDIALLRLESRVDHRTARPICVPSEKYDMVTPTTDMVATVAGWGFNKDKSKHRDAKRSQVLMFADLRMMPGDVCAEYPNLKLVSFDPDVQICTLGNDTDTCYGDSGGPVMVRQRGRHVQYGVVSFGFSCAAPDMPAVSTKVSFHLDWIKQSILEWRSDPDVTRF